MPIQKPEVWVYLASERPSAAERRAIERLQQKGVSRLVLVPMGDGRRNQSQPGCDLVFAVNPSAIPEIMDAFPRMYLRPEA